MQRLPMSTVAAIRAPEEAQKLTIEIMVTDGGGRSATVATTSQRQIGRIGISAR
jgi:hypothetical protein